MPDARAEFREILHALRLFKDEPIALPGVRAGRRGGPRPNVSRQDIEEYFGEFVVWMKTDIGHEIAWAREKKPAGNLLCALGLVSYTEALGAIMIWNRLRRRGSSEESFNEFFDALDGGAYRAWRRAWEARHPETTIYESLRCGLVHEYRPKVAAGFYFNFDDPMGMDETPDGMLVFKIEPYYRHFCAAADRLRDDLLALPNAEIPAARTKTPWPAGSAGGTVMPSS